MKDAIDLNVTKWNTLIKYMVKSANLLYENRFKWTTRILGRFHRSNFLVACWCFSQDGQYLDSVRILLSHKLTTNKKRVWWVNKFQSLINLLHIKFTQTQDCQSLKFKDLHLRRNHIYFSFAEIRLKLGFLMLFCL